MEPPMNPLRAKIGAKLGETVDWKKIDEVKLLVDGQLQIFIGK